MGLEGYRGELGLDYVKAWMLTGGFLTSPEAEAYMREQLNSDSADDSLGAADGYPTTEGVTLRLREPGAEEEGDVWVTAPGPQGSEESSRLVVIDGTLVVETPDRARAEATFVLPALCNQTKLNDGTPFKDVMAVHGRRGRFSLVAGEGEDGNPNLLGGGCALDCQMCPLARSKLGYGGIKPLDRLIEAGKIALGEQVHPADHFLISGGAPRRKDYAKFMDSCVALAETFSGRVPVDLMAVPLPDCLDFARLEKAGITGVALNAELPPGSAIVRQKGRYWEDGYYLDAIRAATNAGLCARSLLLVMGGQAVGPLVEMAAAIAEAGASPVLSPLVSDADAPIPDLLPPTRDHLLKVATEVEAVTTHYGIPNTVDCSACAHNTFPSPATPQYIEPLPAA